MVLRKELLGTDMAENQIKTKPPDNYKLTMGGSHTAENLSEY